MARIEIRSGLRWPTIAMLFHSRPIKREEILRLAVQARLMLDAGNAFCLNDIAGEKELLAFARLLETRLNQELGSSLAGAE